MDNQEQRNAARQFIKDWTERGDEKQETALFWTALLSKIYGVEEPDKYIQFELPVKVSHISFIDGFIETTNRPAVTPGICRITRTRAGLWFAISRLLKSTI